ncbi:MAG TPA: hypothetical protein VGA50_13600 [Kiloniellales bacterium]
MPRRKRIRLSLLLASAIAVSSIWPSVEAREISLKEVLMHYFDEVTQVETCGTWRSSQESGFYRILVVDFLFGGSRLWVQQMADRDTDGRIRVIRTLSIAELNDDHTEKIFSKVECKSEAGEKISLLIEAEDGYTSSQIQIEIEVLGSGEYRYSETGGDSD